ncbi:hypothetical protein HY412_02500 [Candidatus Kaiserbacteria bacterium]|nr:hypothetical protein [Candidatus Kaiserbacteria bacterium]
MEAESGNRRTQKRVVPWRFFVRTSNRCTDAIVIVDNNFRILHAGGSLITDEFVKRGQSLVGRDYFRTFFRLSPSRKNGSLPEEVKRIPMYHAITRGVVKDGPPPTIATPNDLAYQVETLTDTILQNGKPIRWAIEFWRIGGNPEAFENDGDFIDFRLKEDC